MVESGWFPHETGLADAIAVVPSHQESQVDEMMEKVHSLGSSRMDLIHHEEVIEVSFGETMMMPPSSQRNMRAKPTLFYSSSFFLFSGMVMKIVVRLLAA